MVREDSAAHSHLPRQSVVYPLAGVGYARRVRVTSSHLALSLLLL
jgi:hypothetical protein